MFLWLKRLSGSVADGQWFSGRPEVVDLDLDRDWPDVQRLIAHDELPHTRADLEGWLATAGATALVARKDDRFAGFLVAHPVGSVAHLDLVAVDPDFRKASIARPLYYRGVNALKIQGSVGFVAHARSGPGALLELLGYTPGDRYTLVEHEVGEVTVSGGHRGELIDEHEMTVDELVELDAANFGARRAGWLNHLFYRKDTEIQGFRKKGELIAALVLQRTEDDGLLVRLAQGREFRDISSLLHVVLVMNSGRKIRTWVRQGSKLAAMLESLDFDVPEGVEPFTEYRMGATEGIGDGDGVLQLAWW